MDSYPAYEMKSQAKDHQTYQTGVQHGEKERDIAYSLTVTVIPGYLKLCNMSVLSCSNTYTSLSVKFESLLLHT